MSIYDAYHGRLGQISLRIVFINAYQLRGPFGFQCIEQLGGPDLLVSFGQPGVCCQGNRYTDDNERLDLKVRYKLFENVDVNLEARNILDEPRIDERAVRGNVYQALSYGPRYFLGVKVKL